MDQFNRNRRRDRITGFVKKQRYVCVCPHVQKHGDFFEKKYRRRRRYFSNAQKGRKGEKETGILNQQKGGVPRSRGERM